MPNVWKIAPGRGASHWDMCLEKDCILLGWRKLDDYTDFETVEEVAAALGGGPENGMGAARSIWRFTHKVQPYDIVVANKGRSMVMGLGIITGGYLPKGHPDNPSIERLPHARRAQWVVSQNLDVGPSFFSMHTVTGLKPEKIAQMRTLYAEHHPELTGVIDDLFEGRILFEDLTEVEQAAQALVGKESGQGFVADWELRRKLELYAMEAATMYFESFKFVVEDVSKKKPYDLLCTRRDKVIYCEVKGTRSLGEKIILTNGEVEFARENKDQMALFIWHSIRMDGGELLGGKRKLILPWNVDEGSFTPIAFTYSTG